MNKPLIGIAQDGEKSVTENAVCQCAPFAANITAADDRSAENGLTTGEESSDGRYLATGYTVFPGISIVYYSAHMQRGSLKKEDAGTGDVFEIFHCREGRMECSIGNDFCYIAPRDLLIARTEHLSPALYFPLRHYHGITIRINVREAPKCLSCFLQDGAVQPKAIEEKFCGGKSYYIALSNSSVEHIFSELYAVPEKIRQGYFKIKILELMLFLSAYEIRDEESGSRSVSPFQASLAKNAAKYLTENMYEKITLEQTANKFHASATAIKTSFRSVFGVSFYAYIKTQKMESAAYMLEYTDKTVTDIANEHGYDNSSKFANAFRSVKGVSPVEYRAQNTKAQ